MSDLVDFETFAKHLSVALSLETGVVVVFTTFLRRPDCVVVQDFYLSVEVVRHQQGAASTQDG